MKFWRYQYYGYELGYVGPRIVIIQASSWQEANQLATASGFVNFQDEESWIKKDEFFTGTSVPMISGLDISIPHMEETCLAGTAYVVVYKDGTLIRGKMA